MSISSIECKGMPTQIKAEVAADNKLHEAFMDLLNEKRISLRDLAAREGVDVTTAWRWVGRGVRGAKLESFMSGGRRLTTHEAFARFAMACTNAGAAPPAKNGEAQ